MPAKNNPKKILNNLLDLYIVLTVNVAEQFKNIILSELHGQMQRWISLDEDNMNMRERKKELND